MNLQTTPTAQQTHTIKLEGNFVFTAIFLLAVIGDMLLGGQHTLSLVQIFFVTVLGNLLAVQACR